MQFYLRNCAIIFIVLSFHTVAPQWLKIRFNIMLPSTNTSTKWCLLIIFSFSDLEKSLSAFLGLYRWSINLSLLPLKRRSTVWSAKVFTYTLSLVSKAVEEDEVKSLRKCWMEMSQQNWKWCKSPQKMIRRHIHGKPRLARWIMCTSPLTILQLINVAAS